MSDVDFLPRAGLDSAVLESSALDFGLLDSVALVDAGDIESSPFDSVRLESKTLDSESLGVLAHAFSRLSSSISCCKSRISIETAYSPAQALKSFAGRRFENIHPLAWARAHPWHWP